MKKTNIWVVCIETPDRIGVFSRQLLYKASRLLGKHDAEVSAICVGNYDNDTLRSLSIYGADNVFYSDLNCINYRQVSLALKDLIQNADGKPNLIIFPATEWGKCIAADLAVRIGAGLTAECIDIKVRKKNSEYQFALTRTAINSTVLVQIQSINTEISMCTCKENVFVLSEEYPRKSIPIHKWKSKITDHPAHSKILKSEPIMPMDINISLEKARLVFGIGRGVRNKNDLELIKQVAKKYNAAIVGTRAVIEEGVLDEKWKVGQSGISISPEIYVAIGISGAAQHIAGILNAKQIIAINTDERAPIFSYANYCIIDDFKNIFNKLI